ncbi:MAG: ATP-binding protein [Myxococcota bacterium]
MKWPAVSLRVLLTVSHGLVLVLPVAALVGTGALARDLIDERRTELQRQATLAAIAVEATVRDGPLAGDALRPILGEAWARTRVGLRVLDAEGVVIATTGPRLGEDLSDRPEVQAALAGREGVAMREVAPPAKERVAERKRLRWLFSAVPVRAPDGRVVGVVLATRPVREVLDAVEDMWGDLRWGLAAAVAGAAVAALGASYVLSRSLRALARASRAVTEGRAHEVLAGKSSRVREVREVAEDLARMAQRLAAQGRRNREFAGHVAHEFRTPLTTLRGTVELLLTDAEMPADQRERFLANARVDLERLGRMVEGLLALARAEESPVREDVDLDALLDGFGVTREGSAGVVRGDAAQIEAVARNLLENARVHGGPPVRLRAWRRDGSAGFEVEDAGPGISPANLPKVFDRFFTTGKDREGTGLGLAIVRAACEAHGGSVGVESAKGRTVFRVSLPV